MSIKVIEKPHWNHKEAIFRGKVPTNRISNDICEEKIFKPWREKVLGLKFPMLPRFPTTSSCREFFDEAVDEEIKYGLRENTHYYIEVDEADPLTFIGKIRKEWWNYNSELKKKSEQGDKEADEKYSMAKITLIRGHYK